MKHSHSFLIYYFKLERLTLQVQFVFFPLILFLNLFTLLVVTLCLYAIFEALQRQLLERCFQTSFVSESCLINFIERTRSFGLLA